MNSLVVYESKFGNTQKVAETIAKGLGVYGLARIVGMDDPYALTLDAVDLLVIGGPTQAHGMSPAMRAYLSASIPKLPTGTHVAVFDTRLKGPGFLWGSAAKAIAVAFRQTGFGLVTPPESFLVEGMKEPRLVAGEDQRAQAWAAEIGVEIAAHLPAVV